jgi:hypothetical protein
VIGFLLAAVDENLRGRFDRVMQTRGYDVRAGRAFVEFFLEDNPLKRGLTVAERRLRQFGASVQKIGTKAFAAGFGGLAATVLPVSQMIAFDDAIRMTGAVSQSTDEQLAQLRSTALELGRTTSFTAAQVAQLMGELGRAGFSPDEILEVLTDLDSHLPEAERTTFLARALTPRQLAAIRAIWSADHAGADAENAALNAAIMQAFTGWKNQPTDECATPLPWSADGLDAGLTTQAKYALLGQLGP